MSTQQGIYAAGSKNRPHVLNKENYVPWSSRLLRYAKSIPNGKLIYNSIINGPYVRRIIPEPGDPARTVPQMMNGSDIGFQEKKAKLFNEWERFTSTNGESIESYYHCFSKLMNDFNRNKHFPEKIASNLKFLNNLQREWSRHVTIVHQTKDLHTTNYTQLYDFLKYNQKEADELRAERLVKTQDPLAIMVNSNNSFKYPVFHPDLPSSSTYIQQPLPINNNYIPQSSLNQNYMQQPMPNLKDITDPTAAMNTELALMAKAFKLNYSTPTNNNQRISSNPCNRQIAQPGNQDVQNAVQNLGVQNVRNQNRVIVVPGIANQNGNGNVELHSQTKEKGCGLSTQLLIAQKEEAGIQLQAEEFDLMAVASDLDEIKEVNANCILMANLQQALTSGTQSNTTPAYDLDGSAEVQLHENCYNDEIFNIVEQGGGTVEQHSTNVEETRAYHKSLFHNLAAEVEKVNLVNRKMKETNAELTTELARYKNQERCFEISQEKYDNLKGVTNSLFIKNNLSKEKSTVSSLLEEKKRLKSDFKIREDELLDKQIQLENKIKELDNILALECEIERLLRAVVGQDIMSIVQKFSDDTTPSVARKFLNEVKSTIVTLQRVVKQNMTLDIHNWSSSAHQEVYKIVKDEIFPIVNQVDARVQNFEIQFLKEAAKFVRDFQSLANEADESLAKHKALELEIECLLRAVLERMKEHLENCIIKKENEYAKLWNDWYKKCEECKYDKISYDKAYNDMQQKIERLQAQLGDQKGKCKDTSCVSNTLDPLPQKLENENVELEFQVQNYEKENAHLRTAYKNLFDSINVTQTQTKLIIDSLQNKLHDTIYENAKLRAQLFNRVSKQKDTPTGTSTNTKFANQSIERKPFLQSLKNQFVVRQPNAFQSEHLNFSKNQIPQKVDKTNDLSNPVTSNSVPSTNESKVIDNDKVIAPRMFRINPFKNSREEKFVPNKSTKASGTTNPITVSQPHVIIKKVVNPDSNGFSSTGVDITTKTSHNLGAIQRMIGSLLRLRVVAS
ncbi:hypothetical protein Tco_0428582 [Tanacetum coccineum]